MISRSDRDTNRYIISVTNSGHQRPLFSSPKTSTTIMYFNGGYNPVESRSTNFKLFKRIILRFFAFLISTNDSNILNVYVQGYVNATIVLDSSTLGKKSYKPNSIEIPVGNSVVWTNDDFVSHSVTAIKGEFDSNILRAGDPT